MGSPAATPDTATRPINRRLDTRAAAVRLGVRERTVIDYVHRGLTVNGTTVRLARRSDLNKRYFTAADIEAFRRKVNALLARPAAAG